MEWQDWKHLPETEQMLKWLHSQREGVKEDWAQRLYVGETPKEMYSKNCEALGKVEAILELISIIEDNPESMEMKDE